jgi:hypothetical protein
LQRTAASVAELDLHRGVNNLEPVLQLTGNAMQKRIAGMTAWHDEMACECRFGRAHRPNVQIMHTGDTRQLR